MNEELIRHILGVQEDMLNDCAEVFRSLMDSSDPEVSHVAAEALEALDHSQDILDALIDGQTQLKH